MVENLRGGQSAARSAQSPRQAARFGEGEKPDLVAVVAGHHRVLDQRRHRRERREAQPADVHPGSRAQLEVLGDAAVEDDALRRIARILEAGGVAGAQQALVVEGLLR